jgi:hypothetical protein
MKRLALIPVLAACGGTARVPETKHVDVPRAAPPPLTRAAPVAEDWASLGLDFETFDGDLPRGWSTGIDSVGTQSFAHERTIVGDVVHGGAHAYRFHSDGGEGFVSSNVWFYAAPVRGKRLRLYGWIRTEDVPYPGFASLWIRTDGGAQMAYDDMNGRGVTGTRDWREVFAEVEVPDDAETIVIGPLLIGTGTAWYDDLRIEVTDIVGPQPIAVRAPRE